MLASLNILNFTIVSHLELAFAKGMSAFTGETGAGKSIMIDALMLALGGRADVSSIRPGADKCDITACFVYDPNSKPENWLKMHDIADDERAIYLRRVIYRNKPSKTYINGHPFPVQKLKEISSMLVDIHGQHQHQSLFDHKTHRLQLDAFANHQNLLDEVAKIYQEIQDIQKQIDSLCAMEVNQEKITLLKYQIEELESLNLQEGEIDNLNEEHQLLHNAHDFLKTTQNLNLLLKEEENQNVCQSLSLASQWLAELPKENSKIKNAKELIDSALIQCEEAATEITNFANQVQLDPDRLYELEERISELHKASRKHHVDVKNLAEHSQSLQKMLDELENKEHDKVALAKKYQDAVNRYQNAAAKLSESRKTQAKKLAKQITASIQKLGMPKGYIQIEISPQEKPKAHGLDKIEYKVCTNPGMPLDSLTKVASGGELSRISLAIQLITAQRASTPTLLFDEVDVGIGGPTAALVGKMLRDLGNRLQVFCVTHQPQVAASAHNHFLVKKHTEKDNTFSTIIPLAQNDKVNEIARMLGGVDLTTHSKEHAKELLEFVD